MTDIPIIFSAPMVRALLDGRKTMTRRLLYSVRKFRPSASILVGHPPPDRRDPATGFPLDYGPGECWDLTGWHKVRPGDRLWVRENFYVEGGAFGENFGYAADLPPQDGPPKLTPCIHMPRHLSRLTLGVMATKIERLQEISEADAIAEGVYTGRDGDLGPLDISARALFADLWRSLHGTKSVTANPEVVALTFTVHKQNIDTLSIAAAA